MIISRAGSPQTAFIDKKGNPMGQPDRLLASAEEYNSGAGRPNEVQPTLLLAKKYFRCGEFSRALSLCNAILDLFPDHIHAYHLKAKIGLQSGQYRSVLRMVEEILARSPEYSQAYCTQGLANLGLTQINEAMASFDAALRFNPLCAEAYTGLALALMRSGQHGNVLEYMIKAIEVDPQNADAYSCLGLYYFQCGNTESAIGKFLQAIENDDSILSSYRGLKKAVGAMLEKGSAWNATSDTDQSCGEDTLNPDLPEFKTRLRTYRFRRLLANTEVIGSKPVVYLDNHDRQPAILKNLVNYYAEFPTRVPIFWQHENVILEYFKEHYYVHDQNYNLIPTALSQAEVKPLSLKYPYYSETRGIGLFGSSPCQKRYDGKPLLIMDISGFFGHFLCDELPYMILAQSHPDFKAMTVTVPKLNETHIKFFDFLKISKQKIVPWSALEGGPVGSASVAQAWFPVSLPLPLSLEILRHEFSKHTRIPSQPGSRKIYITRKGERLRNEHELEAELDKHGFEIIMPETMSLHEQITLFGQARIIVSAIGSGTTSMIWAPRGTAIVEISSSVWPRKTTYTPGEITFSERTKLMCQSLGHDFYRVPGRPLYQTGSSELLDHVRCKVNDKMLDLHFTKVPFACDLEEVCRVIRLALEAQRYS